MAYSVERRRLLRAGMALVIAPFVAACGDPRTEPYHRPEPIANLEQYLRNLVVEEDIEKARVMQEIESGKPFEIARKYSDTGDIQAMAAHLLVSNSLLDSQKAVFMAVAFSEYQTRLIKTVGESDDAWNQIKYCQIQSTRLLYFSLEDEASNEMTKRQNTVGRMIMETRNLAGKPPIRLEATNFRPSTESTR